MRSPLRAARASSAVPLLAVLAASACAARVTLVPDDSPVTLAGAPALAAPNPGLPGTLPVGRLYYGSGTDRQRREYRDSVTLRTKPVDASPFVSMTPQVAKQRRKFWGFDAKAFPLNARVWYPQGEGPYPLVLIVHGNHDPEDFSDPGYAYLGEHLASRGYVVASIDENFINGGLRGENDGRAWLLLKHLEQWRRWAQADSLAGPLAGKVDTSRIALVGHSRGGEAVVHAAGFNRLARYPDDATKKFDFGFGIRSIVAIAPVDGQYRPAGILAPFENVNFLVFHGSHDGDVTTFHGMRQYQRLRFTDGKPWFKAAMFVYRANHGQWNTVWGPNDNGPFSGRRLALDALMPGEAQRDVMRVTLTAFLDATLKGRREYVPLFADHRRAGTWLPRTMYVTKFQGSSFRPLADFDEDVDVTSGTARGVRIEADSVTTWKEALLTFRGTSAEPVFTNAAWIGWNNRVRSGDTTVLGGPARYVLALPDSLGAAFTTPGAALVLSLAPTREIPSPRPAKRDTSQAAGDSAKQPAAKSPVRKPAKPKVDTLPVDLSIELADADGRTARVPLSRYGPIRRPLESWILRRRDREKAAFANPFELVLQTFVIPVRDFGPLGPIRRVSLVFDRAESGTVVVDDIGLATVEIP